MTIINRFLFSMLFVLNASLSYAFPNTDMTKPHFYIQMENHSERDASISFQKVIGNISLIPTMSDHTTLLSHQKSGKYGVEISPLGRDDQFNIVFTGKEDCAFNVAFYAVYDPKITISGLGCLGGGYKLQGNTLVLYISDISLKQ